MAIEEIAHSRVLTPRLGEGSLEIELDSVRERSVT